MGQHGGGERLQIREDGDARGGKVSERPVPEQVRRDAGDEHQVDDTDPRGGGSVQNPVPRPGHRQRGDADGQIHHRTGDEGPGDHRDRAMRSDQHAPFRRIERPGHDGDEEQQIAGQRAAG